MYQYINTIYLLVSNLIYVLFFCYLYHPIYISCNVQKKIKKNGKSKIVSQPKSVLALCNLILLYGLFKCFTFKIILFGLLSIIIGSLFLIDRLTPKLNDYLYYLNKSPIMIISWKLIHTIFTFIYVITQPLFLGINNYIGKKISYSKNLITYIANINMSENSENNLEKEIFKISEEMSNVSNVSNMSDYFFKSQKKEYSDKKEKNINNKQINESIIDIKEITKSSAIVSNTKTNIKTNTNTKTNTNAKTNSDIVISESPETNQSLSKSDIKKKIDEINNIINDTKTDTIEDMTITITEN